MDINITNPIFHDEAKAAAHIEATRWNGEPVCPHCGSVEVTRLKGKTQAGYFQCNGCRDKFTVRTGTVMERSHVPLHKWLLATHIMAASKKGMSAAQMGRMIGVTYKTAWFLCHRIREAMDGANDGNGPLGGPGQIVEADETFVGGKAKNRAWGAIPKKKVVVSLVERGGKSKSFHVANIHANTLRGVLVQNIDRGSTLMTDDNRSYTTVGREFKGGHFAVNHTLAQYAQGLYHSNTVENFFSIFKRGVIGTYHHLSEAHMHRYLAEFDLRANTRDMSDAERAGEIIRGAIGRRLTYRRTGQSAA
ncbi:IS1595 family transposase [Alteraurantiacibacter aquimixticola]|uniref:IS1595 family transposase n=1 Tax=Alteraurantiacibacter aquimixticola TaxID=2489173 RepID=A0A4T3EZ43_9SPHN|nr:IS1595 family transposase [Alteraurantiacibacter aquimixticola]TIX48804.1 IS1595 family transposase [Alteraurantiacibacter aquimixticola]